MHGDDDRAKPDPEALKAQIDQNLRRVYKEVLDQEIPDRFRDLLEELRRKTEDKE
jgi:hypothetical protein